jgi:PQQ-like domain
VWVIRPAARVSRPLLTTRGLVFGAPAAAGGWLYIAGTDGRIWSARLDAAQDDEAKHAVLDIGVPVHAAPVVDHGRLYVGGSDGKVRVFGVSRDAASAPALLWTSPELGGEVSGIAARDGTVVAAAGRSLSMLDGTGHHPIAWSAEGLISGAPVLTDDYIYVTSLNAVSCLARDET